ncbi:MAG: hypothetical protein JXJ20_04275 [Anaerolineae bacterium]|jgi:hypothetical protein|nr:hypothetical protein [Anaerolineae bacterium]
MMQQQFRPTIRLVRPARYSEAWFETVFQALDHLHDIASEGSLCSASPLTALEMVGWLEDIVYTAQETIDEIQAHRPQKVTGVERLQREREADHVTLKSR